MFIKAERIYLSQIDLAIQESVVTLVLVMSSYRASVFCLQNDQ